MRAHMYKCPLEDADERGSDHIMRFYPGTWIGPALAVRTTREHVAIQVTATDWDSQPPSQHTGWVNVWKLKHRAGDQAEDTGLMIAYPDGYQSARQSTPAPALAIKDKNSGDDPHGPDGGGKPPGSTGRGGSPQAPAGSSTGADATESSAGAGSSSGCWAPVPGCVTQTVHAHAIGSPGPGSPGFRSPAGGGVPAPAHGEAPWPKFEAAQAAVADGGTGVSAILHASVSNGRGSTQEWGAAPGLHGPSTHPMVPRPPRGRSPPMGLRAAECPTPDSLPPLQPKGSEVAPAEGDGSGAVAAAQGDGSGVASGGLKLEKLDTAGAATQREWSPEEWEEWRRCEEWSPEEWEKWTKDRALGLKGSTPVLVDWGPSGTTEMDYTPPADGPTKSTQVEDFKQSAQELEQKEVQQTDEDAWLSKQVAVCSTY